MKLKRQPRSLISKALTFGFIIGLTGYLISLVPFMHKFEEDAGLDLLFRVRGQSRPPSDVVIVSVDKESSEAFGVSNKYERWPRILHAQLTELLSREGAGVIAFDIFFSEPSYSNDDIVFANAMHKAQNVVLVERIKKEAIALEEKQMPSLRDIEIEKLVPPVSPLLEASVATAPFPIPKVSARVNQYWTFKPSAGDIPTFPVTVFQAYTLEAYDDFVKLLKNINPSLTDNLPQNKEALINARSLNSTIKTLREIFENNPGIAEKINDELQNQNIFIKPHNKHLLKSLLKMYQGPSVHYLNFYGFPRTIPTIPYYEVFKSREESGAGKKRLDFKGKAVFVGPSEKYQPEQKDGFYTVFTDSNSLDISGVEIAATAFANLLEAKPVQPLPFDKHAILIFLWGLGIGITYRLFSNVIASLIAAAAVMLYFLTALHQFTNAGIWYPVVVPLFFQTPLSLVCSIMCKYVETKKERQDIRKAFSYYLPDEIVDRITKKISDLKETCQVVYGTCLYTDAERYTSLSETMSPEELSSFMNKYYEAVFSPVKQYGGIVSNVIGDAMLALWVSEKPDTESRKKACMAALDIKNVAHDQHPNTRLLPTRIALHSGQISLGNIGAGSHYEYRPVGDIVNTATRLEGLNKHLGTRILLSEEVVNQLEGVIIREMGKFLLAGKSKPLVVYELICRQEEFTTLQEEMCALFSEGLGYFKMQSWEKASVMFEKINNRFPDDGPSSFYLNLCKKYSENPVDSLWDGVIRFDKK